MGGKDVQYTSATITTIEVCGVYSKPERKGRKHNLNQTSLETCTLEAKQAAGVLSDMHTSRLGCLHHGREDMQLNMVILCVLHSGCSVNGIIILPANDAQCLFCRQANMTSALWNGLPADLPLQWHWTAIPG